MVGRPGQLMGWDPPSRGYGHRLASETLWRVRDDKASA